MNNNIESILYDHSKVHTDPLTEVCAEVYLLSQQHLTPDDKLQFKDIKEELLNKLVIEGEYQLIDELIRDGVLSKKWCSEELFYLIVSMKNIDMNNFILKEKPFKFKQGATVVMGNGFKHACSYDDEELIRLCANYIPKDVLFSASFTRQLFMDIGKTEQFNSLSHLSKMGSDFSIMNCTEVYIATPRTSACATSYFKNIMACGVPLLENYLKDTVDYLKRTENKAGLTALSNLIIKEYSKELLAFSEFETQDILINTYISASELPIITLLSKCSSELKPLLLRALKDI